MTEEIVTTMDAEEILKTEINDSGQVYLERHLSSEASRIAYEIVKE